LTYLAPSRVNLQLMQERYPEVTFSNTREHWFLVFIFKEARLACLFLCHFK
jgi:hypothetical protein